MKAIRTLLVALVLTLAIAACDSNDPPPLPEATFQGLGDLRGGEFASRASAVSAEGSVVVGTGTSPDGIEAFRWVAAPSGGEGGTMTGLGDLPGDPFESRAFAVSADGSVVVGRGNGSALSDGEAFRWENGDMVALGDLPGDPFGSGAADVSADGSVVVGTGNIALGGGEAFRWEDGDMVDLGQLPGGGSVNVAGGVSNDGSVVVGNSLDLAVDRQAFRWVADAAGGANGTWEDLGHLSGGASHTEAHAVSANGQVVVGQSASADAPAGEAFRWEGGAMLALGDLPGGQVYSNALGVSADGSVIVGVSATDLPGNEPGTSGTEAFVWTQAEGMRRLQTVLEDDLGLDLTGWVLMGAEDISDDGTVVVGLGTNPRGRTEAWRAFLGTPVVSNQ